jgi:hypothetical protein
MEASPALLVSIETADGETLEHMKGVVASHLDGFAFREAPLPFNWSAREGWSALKGVWDGCRESLCQLT